MSPKRIQRRREKGWRMPEGAVYVGRPTKWGNPYDWRDSIEDGPWHAHEAAMCRFRDNLVFLDEPYPRLTDIDVELAGRDLVCWCPLDLLCHADVLLEIANSGDQS